jgi:hypothetical protein
MRQDKRGLLQPVDYVSHHKSFPASSYAQNGLFFFLGEVAH